MDNDTLFDSDYIDHDDLFKLQYSSDNNVLNCLHINVRSLLKNKAELLFLLDTLQQHNIVIDVLCLCETFISNISESQCDISGYRAFHAYRKDRTGGGVSIYVKNDINVYEVLKTKFDEGIFESITVCIKKDNVCYCISEFYRPPDSDMSDYVKNLSAHMKDTRRKECEVIVLMTDQNVNFLKSSTHAKTDECIELLLKNQFESLITKPTRVTHSTATLIDNIFVKRNNKFQLKSSILLEDISDHYPCLLQINSKFYCIDNAELVLEKRKFSDKAFASINQDLLFANWAIMYGMDVNCCYQYLLNVIQKSFDKWAPIKTIKVSKKSCFVEPWLSVKLMKLNTKSKKLFARSRRLNASMEDVTKYKNYRKSLTVLKRYEKRKFYKDLFCKIGGNLKNLWSVMNSLIGKSKNKHTITAISDDMVTVTDNNRISECFNTHFVKAGKVVQSKIPKVTNSYKDYLQYKVKSSMLFGSTNEIEISKIIMRMESKRSSGYDCISNHIMKNIVNTVRLPLEIIYNKSLSTGIFPDLMKIAKIIPLFKGGNSLLTDNYRPISLLPVFSKVLEKIVFYRLTSHMELNNLLYCKQFGFRKKHSCVDAVSTFIGNVLEGFEKDMVCLSIFIDLKKAFDTVSHDIILGKLKAMGVTGLEFKWFESYLHDRKQFTEINDKRSTEQTMLTGVPQGSLMGVLLFQILINDLKNTLRHSTAILYADDTTLYAIGRNKFFLEKKLQSDLNSISVWLKANSLSLNISKTKFMLLRRKETVCTYNFNLTIDGVRIDQTTEFKFLGMHIDETLTWTKHCTVLTAKLKQVNFMLNRIKLIIPTGYMRTLYYAHFNSHLSYGITLWANSCSKLLLDQVYKQQKRAVRIITNESFLSHSDPLFRRTNILKLQDLMTLENLKLVHKVLSDECPLPLKNLFSIHQRSTRNFGITIYKHKSKYYNDSFLCQSIIAWNKETSSLIDIKKFNLFIKHWKTLKFNNKG